jgi:hypothetical protein
VKRTELRRKTHLRSRSLTQKQGCNCVKKPKAKTQAWYRKRVIEQFMSRFRGLPCEICGRTDGTCGHHVISKQRCRAHIVTPENIVVLCQLHHRFSNDIAPHSFNSLAVGRFLEWLRTEKPWQYEWVKMHEHDSAKINWRELYENKGV